MSANYGGAPTQDEAEMERQLQLQDEFRRRQLFQGSQVTMSGIRGRQDPYGQLLPETSGSPYAYPAAGSHASPYGRVPYGGQSQDVTTQQLYAQRRVLASGYYGQDYGAGYPSSSYVSYPGAPSPHDAGSLHDPYAHQRPILQKQVSGGYVKHSPGEESLGEMGKKASASNKKKTKTKKPMLQKVTSSILSRPKNTARTVIKDGATVIEDGEEQWYTGCVSLGVDDDKYWLSELQVYLRSNFAEAFGATEEDIAAPMHGRNKPIALGQVGIRCTHCKHDNPAERGQQATSYPSLISGIYNSVQQMLRLHLDCCLSMPPEIRIKIEQLKASCSSRGGRKQYWIDSAKRLGLVDTPHGIHFQRDPQGPLPPLSGPSVNSKEGRKKKPVPKSTPSPPKDDEELISEPFEQAEQLPPVDDRPLVHPEDKALISDYLYLTLEQMSPCQLMEADRVGCYKTRKVGFPGLACRHCVGQAGCGRYFPASEASLSQTTTSQTIMNHVRNCRRCPIEIRENLEIMKRNRMGGGKRSDKPKHGGRKVFFHRLWCRIQDIPVDDEEGGSKKKRRKKGTPKKTYSDSEDDLEGSGEEFLSEESADESDSKPKARLKRGSGSKLQPSPWEEGCVRLTKTDDSHWLSEMECFARSDLVEVFSAQQEDIDAYAGRKIPSVGQVGVRCIFCKTLDPSERSANCVAFPDILSALHSKTTDMIRLHFPNCQAMPEELRSTFKSYKGFDAKVANDDSQQYWVDSGRDIGLTSIPPDADALGAWGITFRRDPLQPSPADELDLEQVSTTPPDLGKYSLLVEEDRGSCTDQILLLLRQYRPCRFRKTDQKAGPGSRGRDRSIGFPGLCCRHCSGKNVQGRYFPLTAKSLTDSTITSLHAHVASCSYCPEPMKASLAYLGHRAILQKAELSGSWKKTFFQKIWDRIHEESGWTDEHENVESEADGDEGANDEEDDSDKESGNQMSALIKAAAIWLTNQDAADGSKRGTGKRSTRQDSGHDANGREARSLPTSKKRRTAGRK